MIEPSLSALLSKAIGYEPRNEGPSMRSMFVDDSNKQLVLFFSPGSFGEEEVFHNDSVLRKWWVFQFRIILLHINRKDYIFLTAHKIIILPKNLIRVYSFHNQFLASS